MILVAALSVVLFSAFTMKGGDKPVYMFGVGASFKDSVVYFTEVQLVEQERIPAQPRAVFLSAEEFSGVSEGKARLYVCRLFL